jgi:hypothetical protein
MLRTVVSERHADPIQMWAKAGEQLTPRVSDRSDRPESSVQARRIPIA